VEQKVGEYCDRHKLKKPNRCTTIQPSGTKSLLTGASPGWHPPKGQRFIRRITFDRNDPVALACLDYGYNVVPAQGDKDENGYLLTDPFDTRCTEWLVEIPCEVSWANMAGVEDIDVSQFSALAQIDFYMQVQKHYVRHNCSATIELRVDEIGVVAERLHEAIQFDEGYISACLSARFDAHEAFPRLPFEPIDKDTYEKMMQEVGQRRVADDFQEALLQRQSKSQYVRSSSGPAGCDSDKCLAP
jgi:adenosylcobalamin-dependent ribonucleoside-triphosphate reductase